MLVSYPGIQKSLKLGYDVVVNALVGVGKSNSSEEQDQEDDIREDRSEIHNLSTQTM